MTFTEIVTEVTNRTGATSSASVTRVGLLVNRIYKKVTTSVGLNVSRRTQVQATATLGVQTLTFTSIEKIAAVIDKSSGVDRYLDEVLIDELKQGLIGTGAPSKFAIYRMNAGSVQIYMDTVPQEAFTLYADGFERTSTLSGAQEPAFPESYHDIIVEGVLVEEYLKLEKPALSQLAKASYDDRMGDLRIFIQMSPTQDIYQGKLAGGSGGGSTISAGSGSSVNGATSYTQTGLITFDRGASTAPFAVAQATAAVVTNLDADKLDGYHETSFAKLADSETVTGSWTFTSGINAANGSLVLPQTAAPGQTAEGNVSWDTNDDLLTVGTGSGRKTMVDTDSTQTITGKSIAASQLTGALPAISGASLTALDAANIATGNLAVARLGAVIGISYTPTLGGITLGNGTVTGNYTRIGNLYFFEVKLTWGTTTSSSGTLTVTLPVTAVDGNLASIGVSGWVFDANTGLFYPITGYNNTNTVITIASVASPLAVVNATAPITFTTSDVVTIKGFGWTS